MATSMLSISSRPPVSPKLSIQCSSSPLKGNLRDLKMHTLNLSPFKLNLKSKPLTEVLRGGGRKPLVVVAVAGGGDSVGKVSGSAVRFRLHNLAPQPGSRKRGKRKGRGHSAGQGGSCGFGMRGQKSRSGPGVRKGFEGGQMPLYRRIPKLRGIAGGMHAGLPKYVPVNLKDIASAGFKEGEEVSLETLKAKGLINPSGRERRLPLKVLGDGELNVKLHIKARAFSTAAKEKLEASGSSLTVLPGRKKWMQPSVLQNLARAEEYFAKKRASAAADSVSEPASA